MPKPPLSRSAPSPPAPWPVFLLSVASGFVSLGYQVMWFRIYVDRLGSTNLVFLLVVACFIGGLGLGALASRRLFAWLSRRARWHNPLRAIALIELAIAATALLTFLIHPAGVGGAFPYRLHAQGVYEPVAAVRIVAALVAALMLLPTFLMGTTFPILCDAFRNRPAFPSELYAWNTLGACAGVLAAEFVWLAHVGQSRSFLLLVLLNILVAAGFFLVATRMHGAQGEVVSKPSEKRATGAAVYAPAVILAAAALSGFVSGALEMDMFRAVRFIGAITDAAMSFTSFWAIVAIFLASTTVRLLRRPRPWLIQTALVGTLVIYALTWHSLPEIRDWFNVQYMNWARTQATHHPEMATAVIYPLSASLPLLLAFTGVIVFPAYFLTALLLPAVCNALQSHRDHIGRAYGVNTIAFCIGAILFSMVFPAVNLFYAVKLLFVFLAAAVVLALTLRPGYPLWRPAVAIAVAIALAGIVFVPRHFDAGMFPKDEAPARYPVRAMKSNGAHTTFVVAAPVGDILYFDSHPMSGTSLDAQRYMSLMAHMPLLAQPDPKRALLICFGVGNTARAIASHEGIQALDIVDLNNKVFETAPEFAKTNGKVYADPRVRMIHDDGREFLKRTHDHYDLITSEPPPPRSAGIYRLYSSEYYREVLEHLTPDGQMTQWVPVASLSQTATDRIIASFVSVFPHALLFVGSNEELILMGGRAPFDAAVVERRFDAARRAKGDLASIGIYEPLSLLSRIMSMDGDLRADVARARTISDERNDLTMAVTSPLDLPHVAATPRAVLAALSASRLQCGPPLQAALTDRNALVAAVPDYPLRVTTFAP